jgi:hypothetical protein
MNFGWQAVLVVVLGVALAMPARAESLNAAADQVVIGIVVVTAAVVVLTTILILHYKHRKTAITGCVASGASGPTVTDERDKRTYSLSGDPVGLKLGERMTLEGKRTKDTFAAHSVTKDLGACVP